MTEIFTAKTVDEAKALAVKKFGKRASEIRFEVLEEGRKGFLGIGQVDAKVKATYVAQSSKPEPKKEVKKSEPVKQTVKPIEEPVIEEPIIVAEPEITKEEVTATESETVEEVAEEVVEQKVETVEKPVETVENSEPPVEEVVEEKAEEESKEPEKQGETDKEDDLSFSLDDYTLIEDEAQLHEKVKIARDYISSILMAMNIRAEYAVYQNETGAVINIESDNNGTIIGRRGETLDALQYLCSIIANKGDKDYFRITINCLGYREKRKETLRQLAKKVAKSVLKSGRSQTLEPMNPYERRVIHSAISEIDGVSSRSVGEEPRRKIVISSNNPKNSRKRNNTNRRNYNKKNESSPRREQREPMEVKAIDLSTSFEKDYKKPKPEDTMEGGLYGKIEF